MHGDRPPPQRDWLGHITQVLTIVAIFGPPAVWWAWEESKTTASTLTRMEREERDITDLRQWQTFITSQNLDISKTLTRIDTQLEMFREQTKKR